jgi:glutathione peroxidase
MIRLFIVALLCSIASSASFADEANAADGACIPWLNQSIGKLNSSQEHDLCALTAGKAVLIVNTASFCGYTPQFKGLEALYQRYKDEGLVVLGFPSDDFNQEAGDAQEIAEVCFINYGVNFPMTSEIKVKGNAAHPIFKVLATKGEPRWNFNKYLISKQGEVIAHYDSTVTPESAQFVSAVEQQL